MMGLGLSPRGDPYLVFEFGEGGVSERVAFALAASQVFQVIEPRPLTKVPLAPDMVLGIMNHRGNIITVVDPAPLLDQPRQPDVAAALLVIVRPMASDKPPHVALQIDRTHGIVLSSELPRTEVTVGPCVAWVARLGQRLIHILDLGHFFEHFGRLFGPADFRTSRQGVAG